MTYFALKSKLKIEMGNLWPKYQKCEILYNQFIANILCITAELRSKLWAIKNFVKIMQSMIALDSSLKVLMMIPTGL